MVIASITYIGSNSKHCNLFIFSSEQILYSLILSLVIPCVFIFLTGISISSVIWNEKGRQKKRSSLIISRGQSHFEKLGFTWKELVCPSSLSPEILVI